MNLSAHKTKIVCTIGPASSSPEVLRRMVDAGLDICRLNFAHGDFDSHRQTIDLIRQVAADVGKTIVILADLAGPKIRLGRIAGGEARLEAGAEVTLTTADIEGDAERMPMSLAALPQTVGPGDAIFLNDGFVHLTVLAVTDDEVRCRVDAGGQLLSHKGVNIPGKELPVKAFTDDDRAALAFALDQGVDAVSQSFVQRREDLEEVRAAMGGSGTPPLVFAKIERAGAVDNIDTILEAADGIMVARGDLGVETPIEAIALTQKRLIHHARRAGKLVITATQMLESMVDNPRPTRAEATDVANAILDGTDCVMLSEESAIGHYPVEAVEMLSRIAVAAEAGWDPGSAAAPATAWAEESRRRAADSVRVVDVIALDVAEAVRLLNAPFVLAPTLTGEIARLIAAYRLPCWIIAFSPDAGTCRHLCFAYGVRSVALEDGDVPWEPVATAWLKQRELTEGYAVVTHRWVSGRSSGTNRLEIIDLARFVRDQGLTGG